MASLALAPPTVGSTKCDRTVVAAAQCIVVTPAAACRKKENRFMKSTDDLNAVRKAEDGPAEARSQPAARVAEPPSRAAGKRMKSKKRTGSKIGVARPGSKTEKIIKLLRRPAGASVSELKRVTGWQTHSLRGFLSGVLKKKMRLQIRSAPRDNGERAYHLESK